MCRYYRLFHIIIVSHPTLLVLRVDLCGDKIRFVCAAYTTDQVRQGGREVRRRKQTGSLSNHDNR